MKLILPSGIANDIIPHLHKIAPSAEFVIYEKGIFTDALADADVFLRWWMPSAELQQMLAAAPKLRWIHTPSVGVDGVLLPELIERNITLTNSAGVNAIPIAEFVLMFMLGHAKRVQHLATLTPKTAWQRGDDTTLNELYGQTVLIIGMGHIGREIARRAVAFGMHVVGTRRRPQPMEHVEQVVGDTEWRELLPQADYIVVAAPLTDATRGMIDADAFARTKPSAYLINIARGQIVDTQALLDALHTGKIAGAGLDVLPQEPLPPEHPLWKAPNIWITPHISWSSPHMRKRSVELFLQNLRRYQAGEPLHNIVDPSVGY